MHTLRMQCCVSSVWCCVFGNFHHHLSPLVELLQGTSMKVKRKNCHSSSGKSERAKRTCMKHVQHGTGLQKLEYFHASVPQTSSHSLGLNSPFLPCYYQSTSNSQNTLRIAAMVLGVPKDFGYGGFLLQLVQQTWTWKPAKMFVGNQPKCLQQDQPLCKMKVDIDFRLKMHSPAVGMMPARNNINASLPSQESISSCPIPLLCFACACLRFHVHGDALISHEKGSTMLWTFEWMPLKDITRYWLQAALFISFHLEVCTLPQIIFSFARLKQVSPAQKGLRFELIFQKEDSCRLQGFKNVDTFKSNHK